METENRLEIISSWGKGRMGNYYLMVTMFLFYSGYGVFESIKKKKEKYINTIPKRRFLKTLINFAIFYIFY